MTVRDILTTPEDIEECRQLIEETFNTQIAPIWKQKIMQIAQDTVLTQEHSARAHRYRRKTGNLGSEETVIVEGKCDSNLLFTYYANDISKPRPPLIKGVDWLDKNIFLIDLVSGTIGLGDSDEIFDEGLRGHIPNIFNNRTDYGWAAPKHRQYKQEMVKFIKDDDTQKELERIVMSVLDPFLHQKHLELVEQWITERMKHHQQKR